MMKRDSNLFEQFERICPTLVASGSNLTAKAVASALVNAILADALDAIAGRKVDGNIAEGVTPPGERFNIDGLSWLIGDDEAAKKTRATIRDNIQPFITAAKNAQNTILSHKDIALMPKVEGVKDTTEFV